MKNVIINEINNLKKKKLGFDAHPKGKPDLFCSALNNYITRNYFIYKVFNNRMVSVDIYLTSNNIVYRFINGIYNNKKLFPCNNIIQHCTIEVLLM